MKTAVKALLILVIFSLLHEAIRLVYTHALNVYEMSLPHCGCGDPVPWIVLLVRVTDFFFEWPTGNYYLSDMIWGTAATALYLWIGKWRKTKRRTREMSAGVQAGVWPPAPKTL